MKERDYDDLEPTIIEGHEDNLEETELLDEKTKIIKKTIPAFAWLVCIDRQFSGKRFDVGLGITSIGRGSENDIVIGDDSVSKEHAKIKYIESEDKYKIYDLVSTNGTFVNGERIEAPVEIEDGDLVTFGEVNFIFKRVQIKKIKTKKLGEDYLKEDKEEK